MGIVYPGFVVSDSVALSSSDHCGIWHFDDDNAGEDAAYLDDIQSRREEARASQYVQECYGPGTEETQGCNFFYNQSIGYTMKSEQRCPFGISELCHGGLFSAVSFDTGLIDTGVIGVNAPATHKFRRRTTCSPLNMTEDYIKSYDSGESNETAYRYFYGAKKGTDHTLETSGDPFQWRVPGYTVK